MVALEKGVENSTGILAREIWQQQHLRAIRTARRRQFSHCQRRSYRRAAASQELEAPTHLESRFDHLPLCFTQRFGAGSFLDASMAPASSSLPSSSCSVRYLEEMFSECRYSHCLREVPVGLLCTRHAHKFCLQQLLPATSSGLRGRRWWWCG